MPETSVDALPAGERESLRVVRIDCLTRCTDSAAVHLRDALREAVAGALNEAGVQAVIGATVSRPRPQ